MKNAVKYILLSIATVAFLCAVVFFWFTPAGRAMRNNYAYSLHKADDATLYKTRKQVEDTCRSMQASYEADRLVYEQYKDSDNEEKQRWAEQAKMRANKTAASYNEYILNNTYVWAENIPPDIGSELPYLE